MMDMNETLRQRCEAPGCTGHHLKGTASCRDTGLLALSMDDSREKTGYYGTGVSARLAKVYLTEVATSDDLGTLDEPIQPGFYLVWRLDDQPVMVTQYPDQATADAVFAMVDQDYWATQWDNLED